MSLSKEETEYLAKHPTMIRLTFNGVNDLYQHFIFGARTIENCMYMETLRVKKPEPNLYPFIEVSLELEIRNERCIEQYGCSIF